jgi:hypothetical protein
MRWGLVPRWWSKSLKDVKMATFNARAETVCSQARQLVEHGRDRDRGLGHGGAAALAAALELGGRLRQQADRNSTGWVPALTIVLRFPRARAALPAAPCRRSCRVAGDSGLGPNPQHYPCA